MQTQCRHDIMNRFFSISLWALLIILCLVGTGSAQTTWHVATNGADTGRDGLSWAQAFLTISNAVTNASSVTPDLILVSNGVYNLSDPIALTKPVTVSGVNGWSNTIVKGNASFPTLTNRCFTINHTSAVLQSLTLTNGGSFGIYGGGVYLQNGTVRNCLITGNKASRGGGVYMNGSTAWRQSQVSNCIIQANISSNNSAFGGGGIALLAGTISDCLIIGNADASETLGPGGGVSVYEVNGYEWSISGCSIISNQAVDGAGLYCHSLVSRPINNCHIDMNTARRYGGGIYFTKSLLLIGGSVHSNYISAGYGAGIYGYTLSSSLIASNVSLSYNVLTNAMGGAGLYAEGAECVLVNCDINYNLATCLPVNRSIYGGGMYFVGSNLTIRNSRLIGNEIVNTNTARGGAIHSPNNAGSVLIENCTVASNRITSGSLAVNSQGGGLYISSNTVVRNCLIANNYASLPTDGAGAIGYGGGIYLASANRSNIIESCTVVSNYAQDLGPGLYLFGDGQDEVWNCVVQSNSIATGVTNFYMGNAARRARVHYTCTPETMTGTGNVTTDPAFVNPAANDYRLSVNSPCMDNGTNRSWMAGASDLVGAVRLDRVTGKPDMGCYEYRHRISIFGVQ